MKLFKCEIEKQLKTANRDVIFSEYDWIRRAEISVRFAYCWSQALVTTTIPLVCWNMVCYVLGDSAYPVRCVVTTCSQQINKLIDW